MSLARFFPEGRESERRLFALLLGLLASLAAWLAISGRVPRGHDAFQHFTMQWVYLTSAVNGQGIPGWLPHMTHGMLAAWWTPLQGGLLDAFLLLVAPGLRWIPFVPLYHLGFFADQVILLLGTWLLARRHVQSPWSAAFICAATIFACDWYSQPWFTFRLLYCVPLVIELMHRAWDSGKWRWIALAGNLVGTQTFGALPYFAPVVVFAVGVYCVCALAFTPRAQLRERLLVLLRGSKLGMLGAVIVSVAPIAAMGALLTVGTEEVVNNTPGRGESLGVPLRVFLTYGGRADTGWELNWLAHFLSGTSTLDFSSYRGILVPALAAFALLYAPGKRHAGWLVGLIVIAGFSNSSVISALAWAVSPGMSLFRHIGMASGLAGIALAFLAGMGLDDLARSREDGRAWRTFALCLIGVMLVVPLAAWQWYRHNYDTSFVTVMLPREDWPLIPARLVIGACFSVAFGFAALWLASGRRAAFVIAGLFAVQLADVGSFAVRQAWWKTAPLTDEQSALLSWQPIPWKMRRSLDITTNERFRAFEPRFHKVSAEETGYGITNWQIDSFLFHDSVGSEWRVDYWLQPFDDLSRACAGEPLRSRVRRTGWKPYAAWKFPLEKCHGRSVLGVDADKLRAFSSAERISDDSVIAERLRMAGGNGLFLSDADAGAAPAVTGTSAALAIPVEVVSFSPNELVARVAMPSDGWLYDAETWHRWWEADVDGVPTRVWRANLGLRAVEVPEGEHTVRFRFRCPFLSVVHLLFGMLGGAWVLAAGWSVVRLLQGRDFTLVPGSTTG